MMAETTEAGLPVTTHRVSSADSNPSTKHQWQLLLKLTANRPFKQDNDSCSTTTTVKIKIY